MPKIRQVAGYDVYDAEAHAKIDSVVQGGTAIGGGTYDPSKSIFGNADLILEDHNIINVGHDETVNGSAGINPQVLLQARVHHIDDNATPDENFKLPANVYAEMSLDGHTVNTDEAITQNFTSVLSVVKNKAAGLIGSCCFGARQYIPDASENPLMGTYGANKAALYDGQMFNDAPASAGGYILGMELMVADRVEGEVVAYENSDLATYDRRSTVLNLVGKANAQPVCEALRIQGSHGSDTAFWNGIFIAGSSTRIMGDNQGHAGTVGINFGSWTSGNGYGDIGIKFAAANRHLYFKSGAKLAAGTFRFTPIYTGNKSELRLASGDGQNADFIFETAQNPSDPAGTYSTRAYIRADGTDLKFAVNNKVGLKVTEDGFGIGDTIITEAQLQALIATL